MQNLPMQPMCLFLMFLDSFIKLGSPNHLQDDMTENMYVRLEGVAACYYMSHWMIKLKTTPKKDLFLGSL